MSTPLFDDFPVFDWEKRKAFLCAEHSTKKIYVIQREKL